VQALAQIARSLPLALVIVTSLILVLLIVVWLLLRRARRNSAVTEELAEVSSPMAVAGLPEPEEEVVVDLSRTARLRRSFRRGLKSLQNLASHRDRRLRVPWFLLCGQAGSRPPNLLADARLSLSLGPPDDRDLASDLGLAWWFLDFGAVLDLAGDYVLRRDGHSSDAGGWRAFLHLLQQHRPERPLDGVILTLSCRDLLVESGDPDLQPRLYRRADILQSKLREAQKELGLLLPVYVAITGCEALPGFSSFVEALPASQRDELFGWSNPYRLDAEYRDRWADEAFSRIRRRLQNVQIAIHREPPSGRNADRIFLFPDHVEILRGPVATTLRRLFETDAYQSPPMLRGIYLCGSTTVETGGTIAPGRPLPISAEELASGLTAAVPPPRRTYFLRDVFHRKIFPEASLAVPAGRALVSRNRRVRTAQVLLAAATVVLALGVGAATHRLAQREPELRRFLEGLVNDLGKADESPPGQSTGSDRTEQAARAFKLLHRMADTDLSHFDSLFLPSSLVDSFNADVERLILRGFDEVVFPGIQGQLEHKARSLIRGSTGTASLWSSALGRRPTDPVDAVRSVGQMPELLALSAYVGDLRVLEDHIDSYNGLPGSAGLEELNRVVDYLYDEPLPSRFTEHSTLYRRALTQSQASHLVDPQSLQPAASQRAQALARRLHGELVQRSPALETAYRVTDDLDALVEARWSRDEAPSLFRQLHEDLRTLEVVAHPDLGWIFRPDFDLGPEYDQMLTAMEAMELLGPTTAAAIRRDGESGWRDLQRDLVEAGSVFTGPYLVRTGEQPPRPLPELTQQVEMLREAVAAFLGDFPGEEPSQPLIVRVPAGSRLDWDTAPLQQAVELPAPFYSFRVQTLALFPDDLQPAVEDIARQRLIDRIRNLVARAQRLRPLSGVSSSLLRADRLQEEVTRFSAAAGLLNQIRGSLEDLGDDLLYDDLSALMMQQGERILVELGQVLDARGLYLPRNDGFDWWDGQATPALTAFGAQNQAGLAVYLDTQRQAIQELAQHYAKPVLDALDAPDLRWRAPYQLRTWESIFVQLELHATGKPGNSVELLESFISSELPTTRLPRCARHVEPASAARTNDFFLERRLLLQRAVSRRCMQLVQGEALNGWLQIADFFEDRLAGRFPFVDSLTGTLEKAADPADIRELFRRYDRLAPDLQALAENDPVFAGSGPAVGGFLRELGEVRKLFRTFLEAPDPRVPPAYDLEVELRADEAHEISGDQIIEWRLEVGERGIELPDPHQRIRWVYGDPLRLHLRWARDSPYLPLARGLPVAARVDGVTVTWEHDDPWSLFSLLQDRRVRPDLDPHTLELEVTTRRASETEELAWEEGETAPVQVFVRVRLFAAKDPALGSEPPTRGNGAATASADGIASADGTTPALSGPLVLPRFPFAAPLLPPSLQGPSRQTSDLRESR